MILGDKVGLYAARIVAASNMKKAISQTGPPGMQVDKATK